MKKLLKFLALVFVLNTSFAFAQVTTGELPSGRVELFDGFEHGNYWIWAGSDYDQWGTHKYSAGANLSKKWASEGTHSLQCVLEGRTNGSGWYDGQWLFDGNQDFTGTKYVAIDVYNPNDAVYEVSFILQATDSWNWDDCGNIHLGKGKHTVIYEVKKYSSDLNQIKRVNVNVGTTHYSKDDTFIYIDNIRLIK